MLEALDIRLFALMGTLLFSAVATAGIGDEMALEECPPQVIRAVEAELGGAVVDEVEAVTIEGRTLYIVEGDLNGADVELHVSDTGAVVQYRAEVGLGDVPPAVRDALLGYGGEVDDLESVTEGGATRYEAEIELPGDVDVDVVIDFDGHVISERDELD